VTAASRRPELSVVTVTARVQLRGPAGRAASTNEPRAVRVRVAQARQRSAPGSLRTQVVVLYCPGWSRSVQWSARPEAAGCVTDRCKTGFKCISYHDSCAATVTVTVFVTECATDSALGPSGSVTVFVTVTVTVCATDSALGPWRLCCKFSPTGGPHSDQLL
jgi:hypothetical protein